MREHEIDRDEERRLAKRGALAGVNDGIREAAERFAAADAAAVWEFMCECGDPDCGVTVALTLAQYETLRNGGRPLLADGHGLSRAAQARRSARERSEEAQALRAAAHVQLHRSRKNRKRPDTG